MEVKTIDLENKNTTLPEREPMDGSLKVLNAFQLSEEEAGLDAASKVILHDPQVIATILQLAVPEYKDCTTEEVISYIDMESVKEDLEVSPGRTNTELKGENAEYIALNEKTSNFDCAFSAVNPRLSGGKIRIRLHFDVEPQLDYYPGYPVEKRGYYYLARRFSSQLSLVTNETDYGSLEKCYGIWICRDRIPKKERYTISYYEITNTMNIGECHPKREDYDLMTLILIRLGDKVYNGTQDEDGYDLLNFLRLVMYPHDENFMQDMSRYIRFDKNTELWKEVTNVTGLGRSIHNDGVAEGIAIGMKRGLERGLEQGMEHVEKVNRLNSLLIKSHRYADLERSTKDAKYQQELLEEMEMELDTEHV